MKLNQINSPATSYTPTDILYLLNDPSGTPVDHDASMGFLGANPFAGLANHKTKQTRNENVTFNASDVVTMIDYTGAGLVTSFWLAVSGNGPNRDTIIKIYADGEVSPSVQFDLASIGLQFVESGEWSTRHLSVGGYINAGSGYYWSTLTFKFPIPFSSRIIITATNPTAVNTTIYTQVFYTTDVSSTLRLKSEGITYLNKDTVTTGGSYEFLNLASGSGILVWHSLAEKAVSADNRFLESNVQIAIDGAAASIISPGTEDWFLSAFYYLGGAVSKPWAFVSHIDTATNHQAMQALDIWEAFGGVKYSNGIVVSLNASESTTDFYLSYVLLYYT